MPIVLQTLHGFYFHERMPWWKRRVWISVERFSAFLAVGERLRKLDPKVHLLAVGLHQPSERSGESWKPPETPIPNTTLLTNRDDMPDIYAAMDIHVLPSHREGFPRALMEGAA